MHARLGFLLIALLVTAAGSSTALSQSNKQTGSFTLQVASFPTKQLADQFVVHLVEAGEHPICSTVELQGRGDWTRVFVGLFTTIESARRYGQRLIVAGRITEFLVTRAELSQQATRPRRVIQIDKQPSSNAATVISNTGMEIIPTSDARVIAQATSAAVCVSGDSTREDQADCSETPLPILTSKGFEFAPAPDIKRVPMPDPVTLAIALVTRGNALASRPQGGLWLTGDTAEGMLRLRWMVGEENEQLIRLDSGGRVWIDKKSLAMAAGLDGERVDDALGLARFISSNEGLLLIAELSQGSHYYRLHIGAQAPTLGKMLTVGGSVNLDNNFDSRI
ncbi:MAG TPA: SPOR domain-containing protein, partial [Blastocatellia bacterium]|nr:SPOR domain-containing protein [Blastocatellia bacterium]